MAELLHTLVELVSVLTHLLTQILYLGVHHALLLAWLAWALLGVNWQRTWPVLREWAWAPVTLLTILIAVVWASLAPSRYTDLGFVAIPNFWWQLAAVWLLVALTCFIGWLQGVLRWTPPEFNLDPPAPADHGHGHHH